MDAILPALNLLAHIHPLVPNIIATAQGTIIIQVLMDASWTVINLPATIRQHVANIFATAQPAIFIIIGHPAKVSAAIIVVTVQAVTNIIANRSRNTELNICFEPRLMNLNFTFINHSLIHSTIFISISDFVVV